MIKIDNNIKELEQFVIDSRRNLHKIPEAGFREFETTKYILDILNDLQIEVSTAIEGLGAIGFLKAKDSEDTIAFRSDIDGLSVDEQTGHSWSSTNKGFMHACGHDGHMAILLGFAKLMADNRHNLSKNILFIFQPAEEGPGGAEKIIESGIFEKYNVKSVFGLHIYPELDEGIIGCRPGPLMAQTGEFDIHITGKGAHGATPHKGIDALQAGAMVVSSLNTVIGRNIDPNETGVLTVGKMYSGERRNIIAKEAVLEGTIRAFNDKTYNTIRNKLVSICNGIEISWDCKTQIDIRDMYPAVNNNKELFTKFKAIIDEEDFCLLPPLTISEDFSYYQKRVQGLFFMLGSRNQNEGKKYSLHNNKFDFSERILLTGIQIYYNLYLNM